jgi:hypothetical protein
MAKAKPENTGKTPAASEGGKAAAPAPKKAPPAKKPAAAAAAPSAGSGSSSTSAPAAKSGGKKPAAGKSSKSSRPASPPSKPLIDTDLAASAAATMVANRNLLGSAGTGATGGEKESSAFRQLKEGVNKPSSSNLGGILGTGPIQQKKSTGHGPDRQVGRNQTFGADVNRAGVPRRTSGG